MRSGSTVESFRGSSFSGFTSYSNSAFTSVSRDNEEDAVDVGRADRESAELGPGSLAEETTTRLLGGGTSGTMVRAEAGARTTASTIRPRSGNDTAADDDDHAEDDDGGPRNDRGQQGAQGQDGGEDPIGEDVADDALAGNTAALQSDDPRGGQDDADCGELESSVYVFGQVVGGRGFGGGAINCSWEVKFQDTWRACMGFTNGVTFTSEHQVRCSACLCPPPPELARCSLDAHRPLFRAKTKHGTLTRASDCHPQKKKTVAENFTQDDDSDALCIWSHPLDFHLATKSTRGWPQMTFTVRKIDPRSGSDTFGAFAFPTPTRKSSRR